MVEQDLNRQTKKLMIAITTELIDLILGTVSGYFVPFLPRIPSPLISRGAAASVLYFPSGKYFRIL